MDNLCWPRFAQVLALMAVIAGSAVRVEAEAINLRSYRAPGDTQNVEVLLEVGGDMSLANKGEIKRLKMSVVGRLTYQERLLDVHATRSRSLRDYTTAEAAIKVEQGGMQPTLRPDRRLIGVTLADDSATLFSPEGPLTRDELDLLAVPANSLLVDRLLPDKSVELQDRWTHDNKLLAALLGLDAIAQSDVASVVSEIDESAVRIDLAGNVEGAIEGVSTSLEVKGRYKFDRRSGRVTWLALLVEEKRSIGHVGPGLDVVARLQMTITPAEAGPRISQQALLALPLDGSPDQALLEYSADPGRYRLMYDRRWHVTDDSREGLALRLVQRGELTAQCNVHALAPVEPGHQITLDRFQEDIRRSLKDHFGQFLEAAETKNAAGDSVYRVTCSGAVEELPIEWRYYLIAHPDGRAVAVVFTVEQELLDRLAADDEMIVSSVEFTEPAATANVGSIAPR